jgi:hypothetical protein
VNGIAIHNRSKLAGDISRIGLSYRISRLKKSKMEKPRMARMTRMEGKKGLDRARWLH